MNTIRGLILVSFLINASASYADSYRLSYLYTLPFPVGGSGSTGSSTIANQPESGQGLEIAARNGENQGVLYGVGYGIQNTSYFQDRNNQWATTKRFTMYKSSYRFPYLKFGYWVQADKKVVVEGSINPGYGALKFANHSALNPREITVKNVKSVTADVRVNYQIFAWAKGSRAFLFAGAELYQHFVNEFDYDGQSFKSSDFDLQMTFPVGVSFEF